MRGRREKLTDQLARRIHNPFFRPTSSFEEAFPTVESLRAEVVESREFERNFWEPKAPWIRSFTKEYFRSAADCGNPRCYGGGVNLEALLREMVRECESEREVTERCTGYEGSPKGRRNYGPYRNSFRVSMQVKYKEFVTSGEEGAR